MQPYPGPPFNDTLKVANVNTWLSCHFMLKFFFMPQPIRFVLNSYILNYCSYWTELVLLLLNDLTALLNFFFSTKYALFVHTVHSLVILHYCLIPFDFDIFVLDCTLEMLIKCTLLVPQWGPSGPTNSSTAKLCSYTHRKARHVLSNANI